MNWFLRNKVTYQPNTEMAN